MRIRKHLAGTHVREVLKQCVRVNLISKVSPELFAQKPCVHEQTARLAARTLTAHTGQVADCSVLEGERHVAQQQGSRCAQMGSLAQAIEFNGLGRN